MLEPLLDRMLPPFQLLAYRLGLAFFLHRICESHQTLCRISPSVQQHILNQFEQVARNLLVDLQHACIDNSHVQPRPNRVKQERGMHRFAHRIVASETERNVRHTPAHPRVWQVFFDPTRGFQEVDGVVAMLLDSSRNREDVGIKNNVLRRELSLINKQPVGTLANLYSALERIRLTLLIKGHHNHSRPQATHFPRGFQKLLLTFLQRNRVHNRLALNALQPRLDHAPLGGIHHQRHA